MRVRKQKVDDMLKSKDLILCSDEKGIVGLPLKMLIVVIILLIIVPVTLGAYTSLTKQHIEDMTESALSDIAITASQVYNRGDFARERRVLDLKQNLIAGVDYVEFGDSLNGTDVHTIRYRMRGDDTPKTIVLEDPNIPITGPENEPFKLGSGFHHIDIVNIIPLEGDSFIIIKRPEDVIDPSKFPGIDFRRDFPDLVAPSENEILRNSRLFTDGNPDSPPHRWEFVFPITNRGDRSTGEFDVTVILKNEQGTNTILNTTHDNVEPFESLRPRDTFYLDITEYRSEGVEMSYYDEIHIYLDPMNKIMEYDPHNNHGFFIYQNYPKISTDAVTADNYPDMVVADYVNNSLLENLGRGAYYLVESIEDADTVITVGGPMANAYTADLNHMTHGLGNRRWGYDHNDEQILIGWDSVDEPYAGVIGGIHIEENGLIRSNGGSVHWNNVWTGGTSSNYDLDTYRGKTYITIYGIWLEGTIVTAKAFNDYLYRGGELLAGELYPHFYEDEALGEWFIEEDIKHVFSSEFRDDVEFYTEEEKKEYIRKYVNHGLDSHFVSFTEDEYKVLSIITLSSIAEHDDPIDRYFSLFENVSSLVNYIEPMPSRHWDHDDIYIYEWIDWLDGLEVKIGNQNPEEVQHTLKFFPQISKSIMRSYGEEKFNNILINPASYDSIGFYAEGNERIPIFTTKQSWRQSELLIHVWITLGIFEDDLAVTGSNEVFNLVYFERDKLLEEVGEYRVVAKSTFSSHSLQQYLIQLSEFIDKYTDSLLKATMRHYDVDSIDRIPVEEIYDYDGIGWGIATLETLSKLNIDTSAFALSSLEFISGALEAIGLIYEARLAYHAFLEGENELMGLFILSIVFRLVWMKVGAMIAGAIVGGLIGAKVGSVVPLVGTAIGFVIGLAIGWLIGWWTYRRANRDAIRRIEVDMSHLGNMILQMRDMVVESEFDKDAERHERTGDFLNQFYELNTTSHVATPLTYEIRKQYALSDNYSELYEYSEKLLESIFDTINDIVHFETYDEGKEVDVEFLGRFYGVNSTYLRYGGYDVQSIIKNDIYPYRDINIEGDGFYDIKEGNCWNTYSGHWNSRSHLEGNFFVNKEEWGVHSVDYSGDNPDDPYRDSAATGDLTGNGLDDLAIATKFGHVEIYHNLGIGRFEKVMKIDGPSSWTPWRISIRDIDGDGDNDIIVCTVDNKLYVLNNNGDGFFPTVSEPTYLTSKLLNTLNNPILYLDYTGNGSDDMIIITEGHSNNHIKLIYLENINGNFQLSHEQEIQAYKIVDAKLANVYGDHNTKELILLYNNGYTITVRGFDGQEFSNIIRTDDLPPKQDYNRLMEFSVADLSGDGYEEIITVSSGPQRDFGYLGGNRFANIDVIKPITNNHFQSNFEIRRTREWNGIIGYHLADTNNDGNMNLILVENNIDDDKGEVIYHSYDISIKYNFLLIPQHTKTNGLITASKDTGIFDIHSGVFTCYNIETGFKDLLILTGAKWYSDSFFDEIFFVPLKNNRHLWDEKFTSYYDGSISFYGLNSYMVDIFNKNLEVDNSLGRVVTHHNYKFSWIAPSKPLDYQNALNKWSENVENKVGIFEQTSNDFTNKFDVIRKIENDPNIQIVSEPIDLIELGSEQTIEVKVKNTGFTPIYNVNIGMDIFNLNSNVGEYKDHQGRGGLMDITKTNIKGYGIGYGGIVFDNQKTFLAPGDSVTFSAEYTFDTSKLGPTPPQYEVGNYYYLIGVYAGDYPGNEGVPQLLLESYPLKIIDETTKPPLTPPSNLQTYIGDGYVSLTWCSPIHDGGSSITDYYIYRGTSADDLSHYYTLDRDTLDYTDYDVTNGVWYYYQVSVVNSDGEESRSGVVSASPSYEIELARRHFPIMRFDSDERCFPTSVRYHLDNSNLYLHRPVFEDELIEENPLSVSDIEDYDDSNEHDVYYMNLLPSDVCAHYELNREYYGDVAYVHVTKGMYNGVTYTSIQYWFYYAYNDFYNKHEGDWEMIQVMLNENEKPTHLVYARHYEWETRDWDDEYISVEGNSPVVYIKKGAHASYFTPGTKWHWGFRGSADGNGEKLTVEDMEIVLLDDSENRPPEQNWLDFAGCWGDWGWDFLGSRGPPGPKFRFGGEAWHNPVEWGLKVYEPAGHTDQYLYSSDCCDEYLSYKHMIRYENPCLNEAVCNSITPYATRKESINFEDMIYDRPTNDKRQSSIHHGCTDNWINESSISELS